MKIIKERRYLIELQSILSTIAKDGISRAKNFENELNEKITSLKDFPLMYRESIFYQDRRVRDLIYKGYVIPYLVDNDKNQIAILDIFKWKDKPLQR